MAVAASIVSVMAQATSSKTPLIIIGAVGILAVLIVGLLWLLVRGRQYQEWRRKRKLFARSANSIDNDTVRLASARAAYERGDPRRVCQLLTNDTNGTPHNPKSLPDQLLLVAAWDQLGRDERTVTAFQAAADLLKNDADLKNEAESEKALTGKRKMIADLSPTERLILTDFRQRFPNLAAGIEVDANTDTDEEQSDIQPTSLAKLRQLVTQEKRKAETTEGNYWKTNLVLGGLSAALAAGAGGLRPANAGHTV